MLVSLVKYSSTMNKNVKIFFFLPNGCENDLGTSNEMQEAYQACKQKNIKNVRWYSEKDCNKLQLKKTDFLVFQSFEGEVFQNLKSNKDVRIVGPRCLLTCLTVGQKVPNFPWPIYSFAMNDCRITASFLEKHVEKDLQTKIEYMGGFFSPSLMENCTHLITDSVKSEKYIKAAEANVKIMLSSWVDEVWENSQNRNVHCNDEEFEKYRCHVFHELVICCTGFNAAQRMEIESMINENGGVFKQQLYSNITDFLICKSDEASTKYKAAVKHKIKCVNISWIRDSVKRGFAVSDQEYAIRRKETSTPTKEFENIPPNFSMFSNVGNITTDYTNTIDMTNTQSIPSLTPVKETNLKRECSNEPDELLVDIVQQNLNSQTSEEDTFETVCSGLKFMIVGFAEEPHKQVANAIENMSGKIVSKLYKGIPDYAVLPLFSSELKQSAQEIVNDLWISECWRENEVRRVQYYHKPISIKENANALENCVVSISNYMNCERSFLKQLILKLGGIRPIQFSRENCGSIIASTHLVSPEPTGEKYEAAIKWGLPVVNKDWLLECARCSSLVDETPFLVGDAKCVIKNEQRVKLNTPQTTTKCGNNSTLLGRTKSGSSIESINLPLSINLNTSKSTKMLSENSTLLLGTKNGNSSRLPRRSRSQVRVPRPKHARLSKSASPCKDYRNPADKQFPGSSGMVSPKVKHDMPQVVLRPNQGELESPFMVYSVTPQVTIPLHDGQILAIHHNPGLRTSQLPAIDSETLRQIEGLRDNLNKILGTNG